jgi:hypothetical protein
VRHTSQQAVAAVVTAVVEEVFSAVSQVEADVLRLHRDASRRGATLRSADLATLAPSVRRGLRRHTGLLVGLGLIVTPGLLDDEELRLEWWQQSPDGDLTTLDVDLNRTSPGFYDYEAAEWFAVPRRSAARHVVGPHVDVHGTGSYVLTFTVPVIADDVFVGVAGADVAAAGFESRVLAQLPAGRPAVILNADDRVVFSTSARWLTGSRVSLSVATGELDVAGLPGLPWRLGTAR